MDIIHEGFGYMLIVGDLAWVPFLYNLQTRFILEHPHQWHWLCLAGMFFLNCKYLIHWSIDFIVLSDCSIHVFILQQGLTFKIKKLTVLKLTFISTTHTPWIAKYLKANFSMERGIVWHENCMIWTNGTRTSYHEM